MKNLCMLCVISTYKTLDDNQTFQCMEQTSHLIQTQCIVEWPSEAWPVTHLQATSFIRAAGFVALSAVNPARGGCRPVTSLGHQEGRRVFREGPEFFELCPIFLNYVQHIFPEGVKILLGGQRPPCDPLVTGLGGCLHEHAQNKANSCLPHCFMLLPSMVEKQA